MLKHLFNCLRWGPSISSVIFFKNNPQENLFLNMENMWPERAPKIQWFLMMRKTKELVYSKQNVHQEILQLTAFFN